MHCDKFVHPTITQSHAVYVEMRLLPTIFMSRHKDLLSDYVTTPQNSSGGMKGTFELLIP